MKRVEWNGLQAEYDEYEQEQMRELSRAADAATGEERAELARAALLVHEAKALLGATLIESRTTPFGRVYAVGSGSQWDPRRNTSEVRGPAPSASAEARAALERYRGERGDEQASLLADASPPSRPLR